MQTQGGSGLIRENHRETVIVLSTEYYKAYFLLAPRPMSLDLYLTGQQMRSCHYTTSYYLVWPPSEVYHSLTRSRDSIDGRLISVKIGPKDETFYALSAFNNIG